MRLRPVLLALVLLVLPTPAVADDHKADVSGRLSFARGSTLVGGEGTFTWSVPEQYKFGIVVDLSIHHGEHEGRDITRTTNLYGLQWAIPDESNKLTLAVQGLVGAVFTGTDDGTVFAGAAGVLLDYLPSPDDNGGGWGVRAHADYVFPNGSDGFARVSGGVVYRFGHR